MGRIVAVNRYYWPDHSATSQLLTDLLEHLAAGGQEVLAVTRYLVAVPASYRTSLSPEVMAAPRKAPRIMKSMASLAPAAKLCRCGGSVTVALAPEGRRRLVEGAGGGRAELLVLVAAELLLLFASAAAAAGDDDATPAATAAADDTLRDVLTLLLLLPFTKAPDAAAALVPGVTFAAPDSTAAAAVGIKFPSAVSSEGSRHSWRISLARRADTTA